MPVLTIAHDSFRRSSLRYFETSDAFQVGTFIRLEDKEDSDIYRYRGTFFIAQITCSTSWSGRHIHLVVMPLGVQQETPKLYKLRNKVKV